MGRSASGSLPRSAIVWIVAMGVVTAVLATPLAWLGVSGLVGETALGERGRTVCAGITDDRVMQGRHTSYELKYVFVVDGVEHRHSDETGRADLWASLPEPEWRAALARGCIDVVYLPDDPGVNRPVSFEAADNPVGNKIAALVMVAMLVILDLAATLAIVRVARTRLWRLVTAQGEMWQLADALEQRTVLPADIRRAVYLALPNAKVHPPWRFATDVLRLRLASGETYVVTADRPTMALATSTLQSRGVLKRKRAG